MATIKKKAPVIGAGTGGYPWGLPPRELRGGAVPRGWWQGGRQ